jgi:hypothetical protein
MKRTNPFINKERSEYEVELIIHGNYELEFYLFKDGSEPLLYVWLIDAQKYSVVGDLFRFNWRAKDIKEDLLPTIDEVIERNWGDEILVSPITNACVYPNFTFFSSENNLDDAEEVAMSDPTTHLSTKDFRAISVKWLAFLEGLESQKS